MKGIVIALLAVIALGVGYLSYSKYREQQMVKDLSLALSDPDAYIVKTYADHGKLKCDRIYDVTTYNTVGAGKLPSKFSCRTPAASWTFKHRDCTEAEKNLPRDSPERARGYPSAVGQVYIPLYNLCWEVTARN